MTPYYEQDGITIYHGDCREVLPTVPVVDLVVAVRERSLRVEVIQVLAMLRAAAALA